MWQLPPTPQWDGLHPIVIHFPIVLILISPIFVVLAVPKWRHRWAMAFAAAGLLAAGAASAWVAASTGEAAGELAMRTPEINIVLEHHEELGEFTAQWVTGLAIGFVALMAASLLFKKVREPLWIVGCLAVLGCQVVAALAVINTGHNGGRLVHEFGVRALLPPEPLPGNRAGSPQGDAGSYIEDHENDEDERRAHNGD